MSGYGKMLKEARERRGLTQEELEVLLSVERGFVGYLEKGSCKPSHTLMLLISCVLNGDMK